MSKKVWQYCNLYGQRTLYFATDYGGVKESVKKSQNTDDTEATLRAIAELGIAGWEMVSADGWDCIWFKRPWLADDKDVMYAGAGIAEEPPF